jgi:phytoene synthase
VALRQPDITIGSAPSIGYVPPDESLAQDYAACQAIMRGASKNYSFASRFLPEDKVMHVEALYAVMRIGDDLVDVHHKGEAARRAIEDFQSQYWTAFETGDSPNPVLRAYLDTARRFEIPADLLRPYFRAMIDDLTITRFPTFDDLIHYMEGSAMPVGRIMSHILGTRTRRIADVYEQADALSIAMQLSNFWRDVGQDWGIGRVYIPQEDLQRFQYSEDDLAHCRITRNFINLMEFEIERAEGYYQTACEGVGLLASGQWGVMSALEIYRAILGSIRRNGYDVFTQRASTSKLRKLSLVARARLMTL